MSDEYKQVNIRLNKSVIDWYKKVSSEIGISRSGLMAIALHTYINQQKRACDIVCNLDEIDEGEE